MVLDVGALLRGEKNRITFDYMLAPIPMDRVKFKDDAHVVGEITDNAGYMQLSARAYLLYEAECDRCLDHVDGEFTLDFERVVADEGTLTEEQIEENVDEYVIVSNGKLDIDEQLLAQLEMEFPIRFLCKEDCRGLCQRCGKNLNEGKCDCPEKEMDPRFAPLAKLLEQMKKEENNK